MNIFSHTGDMGDLVAFLPIMRQLGGGKLIITETPGLPPGQGPRESMRGARYAFLAPLLAAQPYISKVCWSDAPKGVTHDLTRFRSIYRQARGISLLHWQARYLGVPEPDTSPWLTAESSPASNGRVVAARSKRYWNFQFPWRLIADKYGSRLLFIGLPEEHGKFEREIGRTVERAQVKDALEMAGLVAGADLTVANQSLVCWIAMGLGVDFVQESYKKSLNSIIPRQNAQFTRSADEIRALRFPD